MPDALFAIPLSQWGEVAFSVVMLGSCGFAFVESLDILASRPTLDQEALSARKTAYRRAFLRATPVAAMLALLQGAAIAAGYLVPELRMLSTIAGMYLFVALLFPFLWASGQLHGTQCHLPRAAYHWPLSRKRWVIASVAGAGILLSLALVILIDIRPGTTVTDLSDKANSNIAMVIMALWLLFNAPWMEELIFRHYLVPRLATLVTPRPGLILVSTTVILSAAIFAIGHADHMIPAWPKLIQTFVWGLMLGWMRVYLGTPYAILLHLIFNLSAPLAAPFLQTD